MKEFAYNKPEYNLSDAFKKSADSNNYKLLHINAESKSDIEQMFDDLNRLLAILIMRTAYILICTARCLM